VRAVPSMRSTNYRKRRENFDEEMATFLRSRCETANVKVPCHNVFKN